VTEVAIERPDGQVVDRLLETGFTVVVISPKQIKHLRSRYGSANRLHWPVAGRGLPVCSLIGAQPPSAGAQPCRRSAATRTTTGPRELKADVANASSANGR